MDVWREASFFMDQCKMVMQIAFGDTIDGASPARIIKVWQAGPHSSFLVDRLIPFDVDSQALAMFGSLELISVPVWTV